MISASKRAHALAAAFFAVLTITTTLFAQQPAAPPDSTLFTTYGISGNLQNVSWIVCGSTQQTEGCYAAGNLGPFGRVGSLLESQSIVKGNVVTREIYVLDVATGNNGNGVTLIVYKKTDTVTADSDTVSVSQVKAVSLPLTGGATANASMAANKLFLFIGTDQSPVAIEMQKKNFSYNQIGGFSPPINVSAITADAYGYVTVTFGSFGNGESGFYVYGPNGEGEEDGGGAQFMLSDVAGMPTTSLPESDTWAAPRVGWRPKQQ